MTVNRVAVIGGGPGGLMTAYLLEKRTHMPCEITLFEAGSRLGGKILTRQFDSAPVLYEAGTAELYDYSMQGVDPLRDLIAELGLSVRPMKGGSVVMDDRILRTHSDLQREFGENTLEAFLDFVRMARAVMDPAEYYESDWRMDRGDPLARQSFRELLSQVEDPTARRYIEVMIHSDLATEPHLTNAIYGLQNLLMNEREYMSLYSIDGGIELLPRMLASRISARVLLNHRVLEVEKTPEQDYEVIFRHNGETQSEEFDYVVVALPNDWISSITWSGSALAEAMHRHHAFYSYPAHYLRVSVLFEKPFWRDQIDESYFMLDAFGGCCVYDESSRFESGRYGVLGWLLAGEAALSMGNLDDAALVETVVDSLPSSMRGREYLREGRVHRWVGTVNGQPGGVPAREPESRHQPEPEEHYEVFVVGDYLFDSTLNGLLDSADTVVEWILEELEEENIAEISAQMSADEDVQLVAQPEHFLSARQG